MKIFERRTASVDIDGETFEFWINPPMGEYIARDKEGPTVLLNYVLVGWSLGGREFEGYTFPEKPTPEAIDHLPADFCITLSIRSGEAIRDSLPPRTGGRSKRTTTH